MPYYKEKDLLTIGNHYRCVLHNYLTIGLLHHSSSKPTLQNMSALAYYLSMTKTENGDP